MKLLHKSSTIVIACLLFSAVTSAQQSLNRQEAVGFAKVQIDDAFWKPRIDKVATATLQACINYTEFKTGRIRNFEKAAKGKGQHEGIYYDDSDVYKAIEAMAYSIRNHPDSALEKKADEWIDKIAAAQMPDGYLHTYFQLRDISKRWTDMEKHEDYCAGHLIEAAVAYNNTTGKTKLLDVAIRLANHIDSTFRLSGKHWVSGHEEIELALMKLYHHTHNDRYLKLANWYLGERGHGYGYSPVWNDLRSHEYYQDDVTLKNANKIKGHAVRAMYLYTGTADVAEVISDKEYLDAMERVWQDVVYRNMYVTGGIGSSGRNEGFTNDYDLPNVDAYCETCASVGLVFWNQRMNVLTGESKYIDVLEKTLYNAALDGLSLTGDRFFYGNPLASAGNYERSEWFGTACCPANIARLISSLGNYIYNKSDDAVWINLFVGSKTTVTIGQTPVLVEQHTNYPWDGEIKINVSPARKTKLELRIRIPGWAQGHPVPGDLYQFINNNMTPFKLQLNGKDVTYRMEKGYAVIDRQWSKGDLVSLQLPMEVKLVVAKATVKEDSNSVAIQRGPLIYCVEEADNNGQAWNMLLPVNTVFTSAYQGDLLGGVVTVKASLPVVQVVGDGSSVTMGNKTVTAIPYYAWCNRGAGAMQVWLPVRIRSVKLNY